MRLSPVVRLSPVRGAFKSNGFVGCFGAMFIMIYAVQKQIVCVLGSSYLNAEIEL